jgi:hypothetical protein
VSQLPPGHVRYAEAYPPELRYRYQPPPLPPRHTRLKVVLAIAAVLVVAGAALGYVTLRPFLAKHPATLTTPDSVAGMPRLTDDRFQEISDEMTGLLRDRAGAGSSLAAFYAPDGLPARRYWSTPVPTSSSTRATPCTTCSPASARAAA